MSNSPVISRPIRSFVRHQGRMTKAQTKALQTHWPRYGLTSPLSKEQHLLLFSTTKSCILEIGFGMGDSLIQQAIEYSHVNFIGIEVHQPGVGKILKEAAKANIDNLFIFCDDAMTILEQPLPNQVFQAVQIFFPDPWPKQRHHKRRLIQPNFLSILAKKLNATGYIYIATDWDDYARHIEKSLQATPELQHSPQKPLYPRPTTHFEIRGKQLGHRITEFIFTTR